MYNVIIASIIKDEHPLYLHEWIKWNNSIGIEHFYLCDDNSQIPIKETLAKYNNITFTTVQDEVVYKRAYMCEWFLKNYRKDSEWMFQCDVDEFLVIKNKQNINQLMENYEEFGGLVINWMFFGTNGHKTRPEGSLLKNYTHCFPCEQTKCIVKTKDIIKCYDSHFPKLKTPIVNAQKEIVDGKKKIWFGNDIVQLNHYYTKSLEDWELKRKKTERTGKHVSGNRPHHQDYDFYKVIDGKCDRHCLEAKNRRFKRFL